LKAHGQWVAAYLDAGSLPRIPSPITGPERLLRFANHGCVILSTVLLAIAVSLYPGGSIADANRVGFTWPKNFVSSFFLEKALNGANDTGRPWGCWACRW